MMGSDRYVRRQDQLIQLLKERQTKCLLVTHTPNITYLTGFTGDSSFLLVHTDHRPILISDQRFTVQIAEECPDLEAKIRGPQRNTYQETADLLKLLQIQNLGVESSITFASCELLKSLVPALQLHLCSGAIEQLRAIKDSAEIELIQTAIQIAEAGFQAYRPMIQNRDTEKDLVNLLEMLMKRVGADGPAFPIIVGIGERSALPHCPPSSKVASSSGFLLTDWGAKYHGYHSDITRVFRRTGGEISPTDLARIEQIYNVVHEAQQRAINKLYPGTHVREVDQAARGWITEQGFGEQFNHGLGHGIGLEIHEAPSIRYNSEDILQAGMVVTIEPGIYLEGFGGVRIEDDVLITEDGPQVLTKLTKSWSDLW
ncbi:MAG: Xaa-Pro peptidase family protein [Zavarzinella sp.]